MGALRILLALSVFCGHAGHLGGLRWISGELAVELFFVISGFYMQLVLGSRYTKAALGSGWWFQFYKARYFRLLPTYLGGLFLVLAGAVAGLSAGPLPTWAYVLNLPHSIGNLLFTGFLALTNATIFFQDVAMFFSVHNGYVAWTGNFRISDVVLWRGLVIPPAWSLGIEISFYILAPLLLHLRTRWLALVAALSIVAKAATVYGLHLADPWTYRFFPFELGNFLLGALVFRYRAAWNVTVLSARVQRFCVYAFAVVFTTFYVPIPATNTVYPLLLAAVLPLVFRVTAKSEWDRLVGELSYPFYIFHWPSIAFVAALNERLLPGSAGMILWEALGLTLLLSGVGLALEMRFIEPWRERFHRPASSPLQVTADVSGAVAALPPLPDPNRREPAV